jgi:hypothetical protein
LKTHYRAPWGFWVQFKTILITVLLIPFILISPVLLTIAILVPIYFTGVLFGVRGYSIRGKKLIIHRLGWTTEFSLDNLIKVYVNPKAMRGSIRAFGIGGFFGYTGRFSNNHIGRFHAYVTDTKKCVILELGAEKIVVTPDSPLEFVEAVQAAANIQKTPPG